MFKKSLLLMLLFALFAPWAANAQTTVTIGEGTATSNTNPIGTYYNYSITEQLYTAEEIGMAGTITSISFNYAGTAAKDFPIQVYMMNVDAADLSTGISLADANEVFDGTLSVTGQGWFTINLESPFAYDGTSNLLIGINKGYVQWYSGGTWYNTATTATMARYTQQDNSAYDLTTTPGTAQSNRPNIQMEITPGSGPSCAKPNGLAVETDGTSATFTWNSEATAFDVAHSMDANADPTNCIVGQADTNSYQFTDLELGDHYVWVRANCGNDGYSDWSAKKSFHIGYCVPAPSNVDNNGISNVTFGTGDYVVNNDTPKATYADYSDLVGAVQAGVEATIAITFKTGYTYNTYVWVDLDNSLSFEADEVVCYGESTSSNPTTLTLNFTIPATQTLGDFRLRIGSADSGLGSDPTAADPCYTGSYGCFQDYTLRVLEAPSCFTPTGLTASNVNAHGATITWTENGDATVWELHYDNRDDWVGYFIRTVEGEPTYTITGLTPETTHYVRVKALCDVNTQSDFSSTLTFTTTVACPAPIDVTVSNITGHTALLSWTESGSATDWDVQWCTNPEFTYPYFSFSVSENPSGQITGLDPETLYYVRVRAYCGGNDGESQWVTTNFTTIEACPAPTVAVGSITAFTAEVSCTNTAAENFNVMLGEEVVAENVAMPYTLTELTDNTSYTVKVQAICGGEDGESAWSSGTSFMTAEICPDGMVCIGTGTATSSNLPAYNYYNYSYTQQIYTADEIGMAGEISTIEFKNTGAEKTFTLNIYMTNTTKTTFESTSDWVAMSEDDLVFSGEVTFAVGEWTTIELDTPFDYDGTSNLLVSVANVTGVYSNSPHIACLTFPATDQALYAYRDSEAYDIVAPGVNGTQPAFKNRIRIAIGEPPACPKPTGLAVNYEGGITATVTWEGEATSYNIDVNGTVTEGVTSPYALEDLELNTTYAVMVQANCGSNGTSEWTSAVSFTTDLCLPENMCAINIALTDSYGDGWNGGQLSVVDALTDDILGTYTIASGSSADYTLNMCDGLTINIVYTAGSYSTENGWVVTDINNEVICEHVGCNSGCDPTAGVQATYTVDCFPCAKPTNLAAEIQDYTSANLTWDGTNDSYNLRYREVVFMDYFENGFAKWNVIDADGDGYGFVLGSEFGGIYLVETGSLAGTGHNGSNDLVVSASYSNVTGALSPDNYMVSPKLELGQTFSFWACAQDASYPAEHFGVAVSTESNNNPDDFTTIAEWTLTAKGTSAKANPGTTRSGNRGQGTWYQYTVDLTEYAGEEGYIAIRHFDCTDQFILNLDDVTYGPAADEGWTVVEGLASMEYLLENLNENTNYEFQLQGICGTTEPKPSDWTSSAYFSTLADEPQAVVDGGYWNVPDTWINSGNQVPEPTEAVIVLGNVIIGENLAVTGDITIADGATLTVEEGVTFSAGEINVSSPGQLIIEEGAEFMHTGEVPATLQMNYDGGLAKDGEYGEYRMIASPVTPYVTVNSTGLVPASTDANYAYVDLYYFDQTSDGSEWINYKDVYNHFVTFDITKGYLYSNRENVMGIFAGTTLPTDVDVIVELDSVAGMTCAGWNLVGNPFTCMAYIDRAYYKIDGSGMAIASIEGNNLEVFEGVFVKGQDGETMTFTTTEPSRSANLALNLSNGSNLIDRAIVRFDEGRQLPKFQLNANSTKVYFPMEGNDYAIVNAAEMGEMPVSFKAESNGTYTMSFTTEEVSFNYLHLIDNLTGNDVDLLATPSYSFEAKTTDYTSRFKLVFATGNNSNDNFAFMSNGNLVINNEGKATVQVIDVNGRILSSESINGSASVNIDAAAGVYMIRLINGNDVKVQKMVVR